jgi:hypothetical protein
MVQKSYSLNIPLASSAALKVIGRNTKETVGIMETTGAEKQHDGW